MKKFFKFFAVALVAGCMFTACGDKNNNGEGGGEGNTPQAIEDGIKVTFGTTNWTAANDYTAQEYQGMAYIFAGKDAGMESFPLVNIYATHTVGKVSGAFNASDMAYNTQDIATVDYYNEYSLSSGQSTFGDYWAKTCNWEVVSYDATAMKISAKLDAVMFSALEAYVQEFGAVGMDQASTMNMKVTMGNIVLTPAK